MAIIDRLKRMFGGGTDAEAVPEAQQIPADATPGDYAGDSTTPLRVGRFGPMTKERVAEAETIMRKYREGKNSLDSRIKENERWFKLRHWEYIKQSGNDSDPEPASAWLLNSILNKHADAMDNFPEPMVLPREEGDKQDAETLSSVLPVVLQQNDYRRVYSSTWWYKLKTGTGVYGVMWDTAKLNGLGDISIRKIDILNLVWEPGITDIQKSRNVFHVELQDRDLVQAQYPWLKDSVESYGPGTYVPEYHHDNTVDTSNKVAVIDWYYKVQDNTGKTILHYCKFCNGEVLYATENDPELQNVGWYDHGKYPFVFDVMYPVEDSPAGFGLVDVCKSAQIYIDKLDQGIIKAAVMASRVRFWRQAGASIDEKEYADWTKDFVTYTGNVDPNSIFPQIPAPEMPAWVENIRQNKIDEMKETSGNRDWNQGGTSSSVTAASAIMALQEAGSKLSRDMIDSAYRAHEEICQLAIELIRQFYNEPRMFRITGTQGNIEFVQFSGRQIAMKPQGTDFGIDTGYRKPIFDIEVRAQKSSPFSTVAKNELGKELFGMGMFNPQLAEQALIALEMMNFDGKDTIAQRIAENGAMYKQLQAMSQILPLALSMAQELDALKGTQYAPQVAMAVQQFGGDPTTVIAAPEEDSPRLDRSQGEGQAVTAREKVVRMATPKA